MEATKKESRIESQKKYVESYLKPLVGGTIIGWGAPVEGEDGVIGDWPNGPGHLFVEEIGPF